ncbi:alkyl hydroperoxide reductase subunit F [Sansalvadorimonas sp. 2012CJ34-2]|uniref:Alkyl hydroperoxide reductase subunit F n=1 Tax=Parendozoicomonas callyspongiae TaxID=2942213 RepID=A0ABT0PGX4_9GAMM|nr:alkyl hydroperoxide reductase subunit F [Sansalvadorimonas sp. 2012CJ34-2]MCL6270624.1 alkyl hydroperoxide reductase subunit F [Sansalvadorimonas sp. 2012CJ34-2]
MLDANIKQQLSNYFQGIDRAVEIIASVDGFSSVEDSAKSKELLSLVSELGELSETITVKESRDDSERKPSMAIAVKGQPATIRFAGIPMGHEFNSLVLAILHTGGHQPKIDAELIQQIKELDGDYNFESYISLSCQNCPEVVQALNLMAALNPNISHTMIDGALFQREVNDRNVMAVPSVFLNGESFSQGRISIADIVKKLDKNASKRDAETISQKDPFDMLVVGAGPSGASAAVYSARKGIRTGVVADRFGGQVMDTMAIENFISVKETEGPKLVANLEQHVREYDVDIMSGQLAQKLIPASEPGDEIEVQLANGASLKSRSVLLSTGARWREMNVPGEKEYRGKGVAYCPHCDGPLFKGKRVAVIGGGNSGIEAAIDLAGIVSHVTVIEFDSKLRADEVLQAKLRSLPNVEVITSALTTEVLGNGQKVNGLVYTDRNTEESKTIEPEGIFVQIGLVPNTEWLKGTVELSPRGEIIVDERGQTSVPGVFAAGDVTTAPYKQIIIAMGSGANAALGAFDYLIRLPARVEEAA